MLIIAFLTGFAPFDTVCNESTLHVDLTLLAFILVVFQGQQGIQTSALGELMTTTESIIPEQAIVGLA